MIKKRTKTWYINHREIEGIIERRCTACGEWLPETEEYYYLHNKSKPEKGYTPECRKCSIQRTQRNYQKDPNKKILYFEEYRNGDNRQNYLETQRQYNNNNKEKRFNDTKEWVKNNPEKSKFYADQHRKHDISSKEEETLLKVFNYQCAYCGMTLEEHKKKYNEKLHDEHVDDNGYNDIRNDVPACKSCNSSKHTEDMETWFRKQEFFDENKLKKIIWWITEGYKDYIEDKPPYRILRSRVYNEDGSYNLQHELWMVDEKRNIIKRIARGLKKKDLKPYIKQYYPNNI